MPAAAAAAVGPAAAQVPRLSRILRLNFNCMGLVLKGSWGGLQLCLREHTLAQIELGSHCLPTPQWMPPRSTTQPPSLQLMKSSPAAPALTRERNQACAGSRH